MTRPLYVKNARILRGGTVKTGSLLCEKGRFSAVFDAAAPADARVLDAGGALLVPGFLDLHTHGAAGVDVNAADAAGLEQIGRFFAAHGVTGWLCSILTDTEAQTLRAIGAACELMRAQRTAQAGGARLLGIHLEGPFLAETYAGAMPGALLRTGDIDLVRRYQAAAGGAIRTITVAPEVPGVTEMIPALRAEGIAVALGHSNATYDQAMAAIDAGAVCITHTFNAMRLFHQHEPALMGAALTAEVYCEAICDGLHLHPGTVRMLVKTKGPERVIPVTDSIMAAGLPDGDYRLGVNEITVKNGDAMLKGRPVRAGSTLTLDRALRNLMSFAGLPLERAAGMLSENAAALLGPEAPGGIEPGAQADFVLLDEGGAVRKTYIRAEEAQA